ncbi:MAG: hypothetical protein OEO77_04800 [Acidimicrobiia bacterium]|nr:hypothetical protein [Acidimicrobiia bacterium]
MNLPGPQIERVWGRRLAEAMATAVGGGGLAWAMGWALGIAPYTAAVGALNGWVAGWRWMYEWRSGSGWLAFVLDSTWGLLGVTGGLVLNGVNALVYRKAAGYRPDLTYRTNHQAYAAGFSLKRGYAFTLGNAISGAAGSIDLDLEGSRNDRRRQFIRRHEALHVWQNRWFGPVYQIVYAGWLLGGTIAAVLVWAFRRKEFGRVLETLAYFDNPFEYWAYRNDENWPPRDAHAAFVWGPGRSSTTPPRIE